jgi:hypothetical protein
MSCVDRPPTFSVGVAILPRRSDPCIFDFIDARLVRALIDPHHHPLRDERWAASSRLGDRAFIRGVDGVTTAHAYNRT